MAKPLTQVKGIGVFIYTQRNISMYYRTQSAIWSNRLYKDSPTFKLLTFP